MRLWRLGLAVLSGVAGVTLLMGVPVLALNVALFGTFLVGLLLGVVRTGMRLVARLRAHRRLPRLLPRDMVVIGGLALSFLLLAGASALNGLHWINGPALMEQSWWVLLRGAGAVVGAWTYVYFEFFVIGKEEE